MDLKNYLTDKTPKAERLCRLGALVVGTLLLLILINARAVNIIFTVYCGFINVRWALNFRGFRGYVKSLNQLPMNYQKSDLFFLLKIISTNSNALEFAVYIETTKFIETTVYF